MRSEALPNSPGQLIFSVLSRFRLKFERLHWGLSRALCSRREFRRARIAINNGEGYEARVYTAEIFNSFPSVGFKVNRRVVVPNSVKRDQTKFGPLASKLEGWVHANQELSEGTRVRVTQFLKRAPFSFSDVPSDSPVLSVVVPVHNNGMFLLSKCLASLENNRIWSRSEVILVDDASDDPLTAGILDYLETVPQIKVWRLAKTSGSASTPRNIGIGLANAEFITFLDPDNAISPGGYDQLIRIAARFPSADLISGYQLKLGASYGETARNSYGPMEKHITDCKSELFENGRFPTISTQAAVIRKRFLLRENITFVDGAVGQDTLFGWEVASRARSVLFTSKVWLLYFSERVGSVTNQSSPKNERKRLTKELALLAFLRSEGLGESYANSRYAHQTRRVIESGISMLPFDEQREAMGMLNWFRHL